MRSFIFLPLLLLAACDVPEPVGFAQINSQVLQPSCAKFSSCHSPAGAKTAANMNLQVDPYNVLVGVLCDNPRAKGEGKLRVDPSGSFDNSFMWIKLNLTVATDRKTDYGDPMPDKSLMIPPPQMEGIRKWIAAGAPNN